MKTMKISLLLSIVILLFPAFAFSQYTISIHLPEFANDTLIFGNYFNETIMIADTFLTDGAGNASVKGKKSLPQGMYTIYFPTKVRLDMLIGKDQEFSLTSDTADMTRDTKFKGSEENTMFYEYLVYIAEKRNETKPFMDILKGNPATEDSLAARQALERINNEVKGYINSIIDKNKGSFLSVFLKSMKDVDVPEPPRDENGMITDSSFQARYYKNHYFDNFNLSDVRLLRTPLYNQKLMTYLDRWVYPEPDSVYAEVDTLIARSRSDTLLFKYMLTTLFQLLCQKQVYRDGCGLRLYC